MSLAGWHLCVQDVLLNKMDNDGFVSVKIGHFDRISINRGDLDESAKKGCVDSEGALPAQCIDEVPTVQETNDGSVSSVTCNGSYIINVGGEDDFPWCWSKNNPDNEEQFGRVPLFATEEACKRVAMVMNEHPDIMHIAEGDSMNVFYLTTVLLCIVG
jgi:hypothetical protein